ncbi:unnamed protein product [Prorocentrum cordatum]|uniref:Uncharacterized protein n=1 Tax=Prorocentrum cordatum TaxID=2364126 RepID=A0ABN9TBW9_9DINO|nr:unnamed protein product [Polarella glacialis]
MGSVYNMARHSMSENCYNLCKGRPSRRDGSHWCWEDCQQCVWTVGKKLSDCYGEPYDMTCRYGKELGKEGYFAKNGIDPKRLEERASRSGASMVALSSLFALAAFGGKGTCA